MFLCVRRKIYNGSKQYINELKSFKYILNETFKSKTISSFCFPGGLTFRHTD